MKIIYRKEAAKIIKSYFIKNKNVFFSPLDTRVNIDNYSCKIEENAEQFWLIDGDENRVGFSAVYMNTDIAFITTISISKETQRLGFGKLFLAKISEVAKKKNIIAIKLTVEKINTRAINFYEKNGFLKTMENNNFFIYEKRI